MTINGMRSIISDMYPGDDWRRKVSKMPNNQIIAIYKKYEKKGFFKYKKEQTFIDDILQEEMEKEAEEEKRIREIMSSDDNAFVGLYNGHMVEFESEAEYLRCLEEQGCT